MALNNEYLRLNLFKKDVEFFEGLSETNEKYAYDLDHDIFSVGEVTDAEAVSISIQNIISTIYGQLVFEPTIGSETGLTTFSNFTEQDASTFFDNLVKAIETIETRCIIIREDSTVDIYKNENSMDIKLTFQVIGDGGDIGTLERQITI